MDSGSKGCSTDIIYYMWAAATTVDSGQTELELLSCDETGEQYELW